MWALLKKLILGIIAIGILFIIIKPVMMFTYSLLKFIISIIAAAIVLYFVITRGIKFWSYFTKKFN